MNVARAIITNLKNRSLSFKELKPDILHFHIGDRVLQTWTSNNMYIYYNAVETPFCSWDRYERG